MNALTPPALVNIDAEAALLGALMIDNRSIDRIADVISPDDFGEPLHGRIWSALLREYSAGRTANPVTIRGYFEDDPAMTALGGPTYLMRLTAGGHGLIAMVELAQMVRDLAARRSLRAGLQRVANQCAELEQALPSIAAEVDGLIQMSDRAEGAKLVSAGDCADAWIASLDAPTHGVSCGLIGSLDELLGVLRPGSMNVVAGRPGMGKTAAALCYARGAAQEGHGVLFVSLEMSGEELAARLLADLTFDLEPHERVPYSRVVKRQLSAGEREIIDRARRHLHTLPLSVVDTGSITIGSLRRRVRSQKRRLAAIGKTLDLVAVDYLQLVHPDRPARSAYEAVSEVSRGLKALAMDEGVAVMALAQLSRSVEQRTDKRPILSDLRESGQIEQDADIVLFLLREEYYLRQDEPDEGDEKRANWEAKLERCRGVIDFILAKRRNGSTGKAHGRFFGAFQAVRGR